MGFFSVRMGGGLVWSEEVRNAGPFSSSTSSSLTARSLIIITSRVLCAYLRCPNCIWAAKNCQKVSVRTCLSHYECLFANPRDPTRVVVLLVHNLLNWKNCSHILLIVYKRALLFAKRLISCINYYTNVLQVLQVELTQLKLCLLYYK